ncbi:hypothetical protein LCGC14_0474700 [marine sediment metagenome]|uniref:Uncharacterized protein n=1 Tax=marine sediment metagenome TaxID=412755 RepID=A0A0F9SBA6_9ZZZZ
MKIFKLIGALVLSLAFLVGGIPHGVEAQENDLVQEDDTYDSSFSGPLIYCTRSDTATAKSADGQTMPVLCDDSGKLRVTTAGGGGGTEYTEGDIDATITGTAFMWEDAADTLEPVSAASPLPVDLGANNDVTVTSGALTATLSAVDNAVLDTIDAVLDAIKIDTEAIQTAVEGTLTVSDGAGAMNVIVDSSATVTVTATNLDVQSGGVDMATASGQLADGHNVTVDNASIAVTATNLDVQIGGSDVVVVDLAGNNDVVATAGLLHANSPTTKVAVLTMIDGSADSDIVTTNLSKSSAITITGSGKIVKICLVVEGTSPFAEDGTIYFFSADPAISSNTADMTVAEAITVEVMVSLKGTDYNANFATVKTNCQFVDESFAGITHVAYEQEGVTTIVNQDFRLLVLYRRDA